MKLTVVIPTYNRPAIVVETVRRLQTLTPPPDAIIVVDQTPARNDELRTTNAKVIRLDAPSVPHAMNEGLLAAETPLVLFLDDDVEPSPRLIAAHRDAHGDEAIWAVVGQILQPGEEPAHIEQPADDLEFRFFAADGRVLTNVMAGNLSVKRERALGIGGFDENYVYAAYRFETDFALRLAASGGTIWFEPSASLRHLKLSAGGLRSFGDHRITPSPAHAAGDYYFALRHRPPFWRYAARRLRKNVATRYLLAHPWWIPTKLVGELRGMLLAQRLWRAGPRLMRRNGLESR
jgi:GT2 family glycosyltransferase